MDEDYVQAVIEDIDDRFDLILELLTALKDLPAELADAKEMLIRLEQDHDLFCPTLSNTSQT
jgi:hypothetical protein